ncbi:MAG: polysaccharide deacetylase family protein [Lachnospiraceae bacterium]|nr:polysaccharide deacetylase family protein [Lachnospiraceae bacterium]
MINYQRGFLLEKHCSIIMYHYVRELPYTRYPQINGLKTSLFLEQLLYFKRHYHFVTHRDIIAAIYEGKDLPENAVWLTFDDAYCDHYTNVFPILDKMGIVGAFFPPIKAIINHEVLDVNKIHFILASIQDMKTLLTDVRTLIDNFKEDYSLESYEYYWQKLAKPNRFDSSEVIFFKRLLQVELNQECRRKMINSLFQKYVTDNEAAFSRELYMNKDQMECMLRHGMCIGSHGYDHYWLDSLTPERQVEEIDSSLDFLKYIGVDIDAWIMCYPYGASNESLLRIIKERGCLLGLTTEVRIANMATDNPFLLPRLDTNDFPKDRDGYFQQKGR